MKLSKTLLFGAAGLAVMFTACDSHHADENPTGSWTASVPAVVTSSIDGATSASKVVSFDFIAPVNGEDGQVIYTADYEVTAPTDSVPLNYKVTATIKGTWAQNNDEHDDYLLTFDKNTLEVNGTDAPELGTVTDEFLNSLADFTSIEDVEVSKDATKMSFETSKPEVKYLFVKK